MNYHRTQESGYSKVITHRCQTIGCFNLILLYRRASGKRLYPYSWCSLTMVTYQFLLSAWEEKEKFMEQSLFLFSPSLSLSFPRSDGEDVSALDRCLLPLVSKLNVSCWARQTLIKINISIFSKSACERERGGEWERKKENTFTFFWGQSHLNEKKRKEWKVKCNFSLPQ